MNSTGLRTRRSRGAKVHDLTTERARRSRLPWSMKIDLAADHFVFKADSRNLRLADLLSMAASFDAWARTLRKSARQLRKAHEETIDAASK